MKSIKLFSIIYTDHDAGLKIIKQTFLTTSFIDKLNLRLVKAFEYVQPFDLIIRHKFDRLYTISNALLKLLCETISLDNDDIDDELDSFFVAFMTKTNADFKKRLQYNYILNSN